jgi:hypothetical protein
VSIVALSNSGFATFEALITGGQLSALPVKLPDPDAPVPGAPAREERRRQADRAIQITATVEAAAESLPADEEGTLDTGKG